MNRRECLGLLASAPLAIAAAPRTRAYTDADYRRAIVIDGLGLPSDPERREGVQRYSARGAAELRQSGATAIQMTLSAIGNDPDVFKRMIEAAANADSLIATNPELFMQARSTADIRAAKAAGKTALIYGTQDTSMVGTELDRLRLLAGLGVRVVQLTYNLRNLSGDGALEPANGGLSRLGRSMIERIEAERLLLDLSHGGQRTIAEAIAAAKRPPTISHTGCRALVDNPRNVGDTELRALAEKGGVVGIYWMPFLAASGKPSGTDLVRHMDHAVNVCGEDHVAIGTDGTLSALVIDDAARERQKKFYEWRVSRGVAAPGEGADIFNYVADLNSHMRFRMLAEALSDAGWPAARIDKVLGGNLMRLYAEVWGA